MYRFKASTQIIYMGGGWVFLCNNDEEQHRLAGRVSLGLLTESTWRQPGANGETPPLANGKTKEQRLAPKGAKPT